MATEIIADGTSAATSAASTLADGASVTFSMRGRGYGVVQIQTTTGWEGPYPNSARPVVIP